MQVETTTKDRCEATAESYRSVRRCSQKATRTVRLRNGNEVRLCTRHAKMFTPKPLAPQPPAPEDRTPEQITADQQWLRELRAGITSRYSGVVGGNSAHLDTLEAR